MIKRYNGTTWNAVTYSRDFNGTEQFTYFPVVVRTFPNAITAWTIKGNTKVSGTPSLQNPVTITGLGNKTANLLDYSFFATTRYVTVTPITNGLNLTGTYFAEINIILEVGTTYYMTWDENVISGSTYVCWRLQYTDGTYSALARSRVALTPAKEIAKVLFYINSNNTQASVDITNIMLNTGTAPLPYEPYGFYKISILKDLQPLTPIYLSQQLLKVGDYSDDVNSSNTANYKIKKLVLTGNETATSVTQTTDGNNYCIAYKYSDLGMTDILDYDEYTYNCNYPVFVSTHFTMKSIAGATLPNEYNNISAGEMGGNTWKEMYDKPETFNRYLIFCVAGITTIADFKAWLAAQYAAGTPVTIWYILATTTTESVTAPSITTTGGTATIDVDTTVKPSEMSLTYHGWHSYIPSLRSNNAWS